MNEQMALFVWTGALTISAGLVWYTITGIKSEVKEIAKVNKAALESFLNYTAQAERRHSETTQRMEDRHAETIRLLTTQLAETRVYVAQNFVPRSEINESITRIFTEIHAMRKELLDSMAKGTH